MSIIIKISAIAIIFICCALFIRQYRPEYVFLLRFATICIIIFTLLGEVETFVNAVNEIFNIFNISSEHLALLLKVSFVALLSDFIVDTLKDAGDTSLAGVITLSSRIIIISFSLPVLKSLLIICSNLIK